MVPPSKAQSTLPLLANYIMGVIGGLTDFDIIITSTRICWRIKTYLEKRVKIKQLIYEDDQMRA